MIIEVLTQTKALEQLGEKVPLTEIRARVVTSATPVATGENAEQHTGGNSGITNGKKSKLQSQFKTESSFSLGVDRSFVEHALSGEKDIDSVTTTTGREGKSKNENESIKSEICVFAENRDEEVGTAKNEDSATDQTEATNSTAVFDSSSCESELSQDVGLTMEAIDVAGLKIVEYSSSQCQGEQCGEAKNDRKPGKSSTGSTSNDSNCTSTEPSGIDDIEICSLVMEDLVRKIVEELDKQNLNLNSERSGGVVGSAACYKASANSQNSCYCSGVRAETSENPCHAQANKSFTNRDHCSVEHDLGKEKVDFPQDIQETDPRQSGHSNVAETSFKSSPNTANFVKSDMNPNGLRNDLIVTHLVRNKLFSNGSLRSVEHDLGKETADVPAEIYTTDQLKSDRGNGEEASFVKPPRTAGLAENCQPIDSNPDKDNSSRTELIKTPIVCDSFPVRNLNVGSEKFLEKSFVFMDTCTDAKISEWEVKVSTPPSNTVDTTASFVLGESDSEIFVANGREASSEGLEVPVDQALEEVEEEDEDEEKEEEQESSEWFEPPLGDVHASSLADMEGEGELLFEEEGGGEVVNQVSTSFNLS